MKPKELPHHLKDPVYNNNIGGYRGMEKRIGTEVERELKKDFEVAWQRLKNAMAFIYDGVYTEDELNLKFMRQKVRMLHDKMEREGISLTCLRC